MRRVSGTRSKSISIAPPIFLSLQKCVFCVVDPPLLFLRPFRSKPPARVIRDAETGATVHAASGGVKGRAVVVYEDGLMVTTHADGTVQRWWQGKAEGAGPGVAKGLILVECAGFASVEVRKGSELNKESDSA